MGLKDWFSEHIVDIGATKADAPGEPAEPSESPAGSPARTGAAPVRATPRTVAQVVREVPRPQIDARLVKEAEEKPSISFDLVYRAAGVAVPLHGYDTFKVEALLGNERLKALTPESKSAAVLVALDAQGVKIEDVIKDAVTRDKALDAFEQFQLKKLVELQGKIEAEAKRLQDEIEQFIKQRHAAIEANRQKLQAFQKELDTWRRQKTLEERRLYSVIAHFTTSNPVTLSRTVSALPEAENEPEPEAPPTPAAEAAALLDELRSVAELRRGKEPTAAARPPTAAPAPEQPLAGHAPVIDLGALLGKPEEEKA